MGTDCGSCPQQMRPTKASCYQQGHLALLMKAHHQHQLRLVQLSGSEEIEA